MLFVQPQHAVCAWCPAVQSHHAVCAEQGLVCASRGDLQSHKKAFAHDTPFHPDLKSAIKALKPTILIGVSTIRGAFDAEVFELLMEASPRPIVFPLSNPTSKSECTFDDAYK
jgi:malate dehydrogenase (oxaloacetate-decarboxylating)(NADP+)